MDRSDLPQEIGDWTATADAGEGHTNAVVPATRIGRFVVLRHLGEGGMGEVLVGYDEDLHREVAIKLLRGATNPRGTMRMMREAQALARLSHPNVVQIHEVGQHRDSVFLAMELVEGEELRDWYRERTWPEILEVLIQAGKGLQAAHRVGLVHRDFKPSNVLIGADGRARLLDFGLARGRDHNETSPTLTDATDSLRTTVTAHGAVVGTPLYMAPEQHSGLACEPAADQFAFCASAFELLFGTHPFPQRPLSAMAIAKATGDHAEIPSKSPVPKNLRIAIVRGLSAEPGKRWPDMGALLELLERARPGRQRRWLPLAAGFGLAMVFGASLLSAKAEAQPCVYAGDMMASAWSPERRAEVTANVPQSIEGLVVPTLDSWSETWKQAAVSSCEDVHVHQLLSPASLDRRGACLARRQAEFEAVVDAVATGGQTTGHRLVEWLDRLGDPKACLRESVMASRFVEVPEGAENEIAELRRQAVAIELRRGSMRQRIEDAEALLARSRELGWPPLQGEVALVLGRLHTAAGDGPAARKHLGQALDHAEATQDVEQQARVWSALNQAERLTGFDAERARWMWQRQSALFQDVEPTVRQQAQLLADLGQTQELAGEVDAAQKSLVQAKTLLESIEPTPAWQLATVLHNLANLLAYTGESAEAKLLFEQARVLESGGGDDVLAEQPQTAASELDRGIGLIQAGEFDRAVEHLEQALAAAIVEAGPRSELVVRFHVALAAAHAELENDEGLRMHAELADALTASTLGPTHPLRVDVLSAVGVSAQRDKQFERSIRAYEASLRLVKRIKPANSLPVALAEYNVADVLIEKGDDTRGSELLARVLPKLREGLGAEDPFVAEVAQQLAESLERQKLQKL